MNFTDLQIEGAKENAELHELCSKSEVSNVQAIKFLNWYHSHSTDYFSVEEAKRAGLLGLSTNGCNQQLSTWQDILKGE